MIDYKDQIDKLLDEAGRLPNGPSKVMLLEEAVRTADTHQDLSLGFALRKELIRAATFSGQKEKSLVAFTWRLAQCDRDPEQFPESDTLWHYKWIADAITNFPQITRAQIDDILKDMEIRYTRSGLSVRPVWKERCRAAMEMGEREQAQEYYRRWSRTKADYGNDCTACERNFQVTYMIWAGRLEPALEYARPLLNGRQGCAEVPHVTYGQVLEPLVRLGRWEEARNYQRKGYPMISDNRNFLEEAGQHITFLVLAGETASALEVLERHLLWALESLNAFKQFLFYLSAGFLLRRLHESGMAMVHLRLPPSFPMVNKEGNYDTVELARWFDREARALAARFDARNGNDSFARRVEAHEGLKQWIPSAS